MKQQQMNALVYTGTLEQTYRLEPKPQPKAGHSLVAVEATAICAGQPRQLNNKNEKNNDKKYAKKINHIIL